MTNEQYQHLTGRTECDYAVVLENLQNRPELVQHLRACYLLAVRFGEQMSLLKKTLFYGKKIDDFDVQYAVMDPDDRAAAIDRLAADDCRLLKLLHGPIGMCTESDELFQMTTVSILEGKPFDTVNAIEETGDVTWYIGRESEHLGTSIDRIHEINIDKLSKRYPEKFTVEDCENRDLEGERKLLEDAVAA